MEPYLLEREVQTLGEAKTQLVEPVGAIRSDGRFRHIGSCRRRAWRGADGTSGYRVERSTGLVSRVVSADQLVEEAIKLATKIAEMSRPSVLMAKEAVNRAFETTLAEGVHFERRLFHSLFATEDQKEGMAAFAEKRKPRFKNR